MQAILNISCGLDVHKDTVVACILKTSHLSLERDDKEEVEKEIRTFGTFPDTLKELRDWLESEDCHHVAMESTGVYWHPVYDTLETAFGGDIELLVVNARHMRNVPGKKTDIKDAEWIAKLLRSGLLAGSFIPSHEVRELRQLTRYRKCIVEDITVQKNRIEKTLQSAGFKLSSFLSDVFGVSGRNLMRVLIEKGKLAPHDIEIETRRISAEKKADLKRAITGELTLKQRSFLKLQLSRLDAELSHLFETERSIAELSAVFQDDIERLDTIPGIATTAATSVIAEIGTDMSKFPTPERFCSWAGLAPGDNESAGKKKVHASLTETHILRV
jgi:transposase